MKTSRNIWLRSHLPVFDRCRVGVDRRGLERSAARPEKSLAAGDRTGIMLVIGFGIMTPRDWFAQATRSRFVMA
jgi:hypothetical protein